ncbi:hypothetical protein [Streptomyces sp. NPDC058632]|uniref:hypothetical protein n=1 Tax=Streptomyces sp. NPDC058632 TaxID=3346567 RepID=UPI00364B5EDD
MTVGHLPWDAPTQVTTGPGAGTRPSGLRVVAGRGSGHRRDDGVPSAPFFGVLGPLEARGGRGHLDLGRRSAAPCCCGCSWRTAAR